MFDKRNQLGQQQKKNPPPTLILCDKQTKNLVFSNSIEFRNRLNAEINESSTNQMMMMKTLYPNVAKIFLRKKNSKILFFFLPPKKNKQNKWNREKKTRWNPIKKKTLLAGVPNVCIVILTKKKWINKKSIVDHHWIEKKIK